MIDAVVRWMGEHFTPEQYLFWTRIECLAWTGADLVIVYCLLRLANLARQIAGMRRHIVSFAILGLTVLLIPAVAVAPGGQLIFVLELLITMPHFVIILYVLAADAATMARALHRLLETGAPAGD